MMEVFQAFKCEQETYFLGVQLMDLFLYRLSQLKYTDTVQKTELHLIGTTAIYIASKMEDILPLSVHTIVTSILHNEYSQ